MTSDRAPRSIATAIALIEAEQRDLYGQLKALDDALSSLRAIDRDVRPEKIPTRRAPKRRRAFTSEEKQRGADLAREIGVGQAANQIGISWGMMRDWRDRFPAVAPSAALSIVPPEWDRPDESTAATAVLLDRVADGRKLACSCGMTFEDSEGWRAHNEGLGLAEFRDHRLAVIR
jgi:transposase-like protein